MDDFVKMDFYIIELILEKWLLITVPAHIT